MTRLERRYRLLLRTLPRGYRQEREEEMVATFLAYRDEHRPGEDGWPAWPEVYSTAGLALRTRLIEAGTPRSQALGHVARLIALLGLVTQSALAIGGLQRGLVTALTSSQSLSWSWQALLVGPGRSLVIVASVALLIMGRCRWAKFSALAAALPGLVPLTGCAIGQSTLLSCGVSANPTAAGSVIINNLPLWITIGCLYLGFRREAPLPKPGQWLLTLFAAAQVLYLFDLFTVARPIWELVSIPGWALSAAATAYFALVAARKVEYSTAWAVALAVSAAATLPAQYASWHHVLQWPTMLASSLSRTLVDTQIAVTTLAVLALAALAACTFRRTPSARIHNS
ncbi:hypothetical protein AB0F91_42950 [Amycolatopsis sp. NPDC023774]|uniref:hypothetical protein n=1 Tax=Amycolatopsis sp. NPDC023774 TaxID=3155015 RepID=UPI0033F61F86